MTENEDPELVSPTDTPRQKLHVLQLTLKTTRRLTEQMSTASHKKDTWKG